MNISVYIHRTGSQPHLSEKLLFTLSIGKFKLYTSNSVLDGSLLQSLPTQSSKKIMKEVLGRNVMARVEKACEMLIAITHMYSRSWHW